MSEGQLAVIETKLDGVGTRLNGVETRLDGVETRLDGVEMRLEGVETRLDRVETQLDGVQTHLDRVETRLDRVETKVDGVAEDLRHRGDELGRQMRVLHEDLVDKIKALAPDFGPIRREFTEADANLKHDIDRRLTPIEAAIRGRT